MARRDSLKARCISKSEFAADEDGFVRMSRLAFECGARIESRPLLVEAVIATDSKAQPGSPRWVVLVDSERFGVCNLEIESESRLSPLASRLRTTIAHELLHTLTLHAGAEGIHADMSKGKSQPHIEYLKRIEQETEKYTPLLLIPERSVDALASTSKISLNDLLNLRKASGASREMLVSRLALMDQGDSRLHKTGLQDIAIGFVARNPSTTFDFLPWPLFHNFELNRYPWLIQQLLEGHKIAGAELVQDNSFFLNGGKKLEVEFNGHAFSEKLKYMKMRVRLTIESVPWNRKFPFLFMVKKIPL